MLYSLRWKPTGYSFFTFRIIFSQRIRIIMTIFPVVKGALHAWVWDDRWCMEVNKVNDNSHKPMATLAARLPILWNMLSYKLSAYATAENGVSCCNTLYYYALDSFSSGLLLRLISFYLYVIRYDSSTGKSLADYWKECNFSSFSHTQ
jgi:hypothetical protein